jgi:hypothetical protein
MRVHATFPGLAALQLVKCVIPTRCPNLTRDRPVYFPGRRRSVSPGMFFAKTSAHMSEPPSCEHLLHRSELIPVEAPAAHLHESGPLALWPQLEPVQVEGQAQPRAPWSF